MRINLREKIEEIREKPEHIRMRYLWGCVSLSMVFVFIIFAFSVQDNFRTVVSVRDTAEALRSQVELSKPSLQKLFDTAEPLNVEDKRKEIEGGKYFDDGFTGTTTENPAADQDALNPTGVPQFRNQE